MAVSLITTIQRWKCLSTDSKHIEGIREGSTINETDTGKQFIWINSRWVEDLSMPLSIAKAVDIGNAQKSLLEQILIESIATKESMAELLAVTKGV